MIHIHQDETGTWQLAGYFAYLASVRDQLPAGAAAFATDPDHISLTSPHSLHDAWLEEMSIAEPSAGSRSELRTTQITLWFLGPMHDRMQVLAYRDVHSYAVDARSIAAGHGDLLVHEVRLADDGRVIHELVFATGATIVIECRDLVYTELPRP